MSPSLNIPLHFECHCVLFYIWVSEYPKYILNSLQFHILVRMQKDFVAVNMAAVIVSRSVCSDPNLVAMVHCTRVS